MASSLVTLDLAIIRATHRTVNRTVHGTFSLPLDLVQRLAAPGLPVGMSQMTGHNDQIAAAHGALLVAAIDD
jgi:hypothetical protein